MAVAVGTVTISTAAVNTTFTISGLPFQPDWIIFAWSGAAAFPTNAEQDHKFGMGFATGTASRRAYASQSDHGVGSAGTDHMWRSDCCILTLTTAGAVDGRADLNAINSDGFQLIIDDQFAVAAAVGWICGTADSVAIVDFSDPAGTGNQDYNAGIDMTAGGVDDKFVFFLGGVDAAVDTSIVYSLISVGFAAGDTPAEAAMWGNGSDGPTTSVTNGYARTGRSIAAGYDDAVVARASLTTWLSTGFRLNWAEVDAGTTMRFSALVVKGGNYVTVGDALTQTGTSNTAEGTTYEPTGLLILSAARAASVDDTATAHDTRIVGAADSASNRWTVCAQDKDASGTMDVWVSARTDAMYVNPDVAATMVVEGLMDLVSFDATPGFTFVMDDADPSQNYFAYLAFADVPGGGGPSDPWIPAFVDRPKTLLRRYS